MPANKSTKPSKKSIAAFRANTIAKDEAFTRKDVVFGLVEACLGNAQFRLKLSDGSEGRGAPLGKFTFGTLRIAPGHVVICEAGKGVLTIIGRFDSRKDVAKLIDKKLAPRSFLTGDVQGACFEDGFEFEEQENQNDEDEEDDKEEKLKISHYLKQYKTKKEKTINPMQQLSDVLEAEEKAQNDVQKEDDDFDYESRRFKRKVKAKAVVASVKKEVVEEPEDFMFEHQRLQVPDNWESFIDSI
jgi:translation initiation factor IF-1